MIPTFYLHRITQLSAVILEITSLFDNKTDIDPLCDELRAVFSQENAPHFLIIDFNQGYFGVPSIVRKHTKDNGILTDIDDVVNSHTEVALIGNAIWAHFPSNWKKYTSLGTALDSINNRLG